MINPIEEYLINKDDTTGNLVTKELFSINDNKELDLKTDLNDNDIKNISSMYYNDLFLKRMGFKPIFCNYYLKFMRLRISKDRQSRKEFVNVNKSDNSDETLGKLGDLSNIINTRK